MRGTRAPLFAAAAAASALAVYADALANPFVFDDQRAIVGNPSIRELANLRWVIAGSRRPLVNLSYAIDWTLGGGRPGSFHLTSALLHAFNVLLLFALARRIARDAGDRTGRAPDEDDVWAPFAASVLFAVHPALSEAVGYASGRAGVLCMTFGLASLLAWRRGLDGRRSFTALALVLLALALGSKETAAMLPFAYLAYDRWLAPAGGAARRRLITFHAPLFALCAAAGLARAASYLRLEGGAARPAWQHLLTQLGVVWRYALMLAAPTSQSVVHEIAPVASPLDPAAWLAGAALAAVTAAVVRVRRRAPMLAFGWMWFLLFLTPACVVPLAESMAEHRVYEASIGVFLLAGALVAAAGRPAPVRMIAAAAVVLAIATVARNRVWADPVRLWRDAAAKAPSVWAPHYALADALRESGDCAGAIEEYRNAITLVAGEPRAHVNLGICLARLGRLDDADEALRAALDLAPDDATIEVDAAVLALRRHRDDEARAHLRRALALAPDYSKAKSYLARLDHLALDRPGAE